ncbi:hypothetical protein [Erythrobacter sp. F6033]|uniref:hypothetical protein n=1 Tax=Erythrobacter sp. F6033 TaxID=2926401 RepID=UPI001FF24559|nr:hypothetical protein [Erythrobacter sp. F6033]MCK0127647.1 hypothetical protein [Erythrobacter sp. F6033]
MTGKISNTLPRFAALSLSALLLAGCAIEQPSSLTHRLALSNAITDVEMTADPEALAMKVGFADALTRAFSEQNISSKTGSRWIADFAVSAQPAQTSVVTVAQEQQGVSPSAGGGVKAKWFHKCKPERVRGSLAVFDRDANELVGKAEGHFIACPGDRAEMDALAALLVRSVTSSAALGTSQE